MRVPIHRRSLLIGAAAGAAAAALPTAAQAATATCSWVGSNSGRTLTVTVTPAGREVHLSRQISPTAYAPTVVWTSASAPEVIDVSGLQAGTWRIAVTDPGVNQAPGPAGWSFFALTLPLPGAAPTTGYTRPTGANYVRYEDLHRSGDTLKATVARCPAGKIMTFPPGNFDLTGFTDTGSSGLFVPQNCGGLWGSGPGTLAGTVGSGTDGTYFRMVPNSSSMAASATGATVLRTDGASVQQSFGQFAVVGSAQPNTFAGFSAHQGAVRIDLTDVASYGHQGYAHYPPGETFGINIDSYPDHSLTRVEADGRRADGNRYGSSPMTAQHCSRGTWTNCYAHHAVAGMPTFYEASGIVTYNFKSEDNGTGSGAVSGSCINHERTTGIVHHNPQLLLDRTNGNTGVHITHSNDAYTPSETRCANWTNGSLTIISPTWSNAFGNGYLYAQTFNPEQNNPSTQTTYPAITVNGAALAYVWIDRNGKHNIT